MLESEAFKTYRAYATGEKAPKSKAIKKQTDSESSPKTKPSQASKGKRIKTSAKGDKPATTKSKGLTVLSEVMELTFCQRESEEESWTFSQGEDEEENEEHDSDDDNDDNDDEDNDQENDSQRIESDDSGDEFVHPTLSTYKADEEEEEKEEEKAEDDDEVTSDQKVSTPPDYELMEEDVNQEDDDTMGEDQEDEENGELYGDLNLNLDRQIKMLNDGAEVLVRSTNQPLTSYAVASSLSELELKKILMDKMEENKSIDRSKVQKNLYNALVEAYNYDKDLFSSYGNVVTIPRGHDDEDKDEEPSAGSNRGTKRRRSGKEA
ncbi:hypothetical protein Tco_1420299 [Tanacetum coccineum]